MSLALMFQVLHTAKLPIGIGLFGLVLTVGSSNNLIKNAGASMALMASGAAVVTITHQDERLAEIRKLQASHERREAALKTSMDMAMADVVEAKQWAHQQDAIAKQSKRMILQLQAHVSELKANRNRLAAEVENLTAQLTQMSAGVTTWQMEQALVTHQFAALENERQQLMNELYETAITETLLATNLAGREAQFTADMQYQLTQKKKLKAEVAQTRNHFQRELADAQTHITELETALAKKTALATEMLTELEADATKTFSHFNEKIKTQDQIIISLHQQIETLKGALKKGASKKASPALSRKPFNNASASHVMNTQEQYLN